MNPHMFVESRSIINTVENQQTKTVYKTDVQGKVSLITDTYGFVEFTPENNILTTKPGQVFFYQMDLVGAHPSEIEVGDIVQFDVVMDKKSKIYVGKNVYLITGKEEREMNAKSKNEETV